MKRTVSTTAGRSTPTTSAIGLPMSSVSSTASASAFSSMSFANRYMTSMRARRHLRPAAGPERLRSGGHRAVDVFGRARRHLGDHLAVRGVDALDAPALFRVDVLAADEQARFGLLLRLVGDGLPAGMGVLGG